ncbi:fluoride efflux transporter CrcB [Nitrincola alkalilacustris]|uniref:fluoride efflux transporter CrcB n=1 Tax=Nitrincola alkalilacustris TaxID=1571224 RepID=UPI00124C7166|nr:fluoride efflux transporter CrcB [Nitrincola alkalilacustris]
MPVFIYSLICVALGSALGGMARYCVSDYVGHKFGAHFPWGTLLVNVSGALVIGFLAALAGTLLAHSGLFWQLAVTGFLGSYTTVSSFSLQTLALLREGYLLRALVNITLSLLLCLVCVGLGYWFGSWLESLLGGGLGSGVISVLEMSGQGSLIVRSDA